MSRKSIKTTKVSYEEWEKKFEVLMDEARNNGFGVLAHITKYGMNNNIDGDDLDALNENFKRFTDGSTVMVNIWLKTIPLVTAQGLIMLDLNDEFVKTPRSFPLSKLVLKKLAIMLRIGIQDPKQKKVVKKIKKLTEELK